MRYEVWSLRIGQTENGRDSGRCAGIGLACGAACAAGTACGAGCPSSAELVVLCTVSCGVSGSRLGTVTCVVLSTAWTFRRTVKEPASAPTLAEAIDSSCACDVVESPLRSAARSIPDTPDANSAITIQPATLSACEVAEGVCMVPPYSGVEGSVSAAA